MTAHRKPSHDSEWEARFRAMERAGCSASQIAVAFGVSTRSVSRWRQRLGLSHQPASVARPASDRERAAALLDDGCSLNEVAQTLGVSWITVRHWFPDRPAWTRKEASARAVQARQFNNIDKGKR